MLTTLSGSTVNSLGRSGARAPAHAPARESAALDLYPLNDDVLDGALVGGSRRRDRVNDLPGLLVGDLTEDRVLGVEMRRRANGDEELGPVGTAAVELLAGVGHGQQVRPVEHQLRVDLVVEVVPGS